MKNCNPPAKDINGKFQFIGIPGAYTKTHGFPGGSMQKKYGKLQGSHHKFNQKSKKKIDIVDRGGVHFFILEKANKGN